MKLKKFFTTDLLWNKPIELVVQSYMEICFSVLLQTRQFKWHSVALILNNVSFVLVSAIMVLFPIWQLWFINKLYKSTEEEREEYNENYEQAY
jgi:hypothetical protein